MKNYFLLYIISVNMSLNKDFNENKNPLLHLIYSN